MIASELLRQPAAQAIGWALIHFVWQGALIGLLTAAVLLALRWSASDVRYVVATIALSLMLTMPAVTAVQTWRAATAGADLGRFTDAGRPNIPPSRTASAFANASADRRSGGGQVGRAANDLSLPTVRAGDDALTTPIVTSRDARTPHPIAARDSIEAIPGIARIEPWLPVLLFAWMCGVSVLTLRLASGWMWVQRMKTHGTRPADDAWHRMAARLSRRLHISRPIRLLESTIVEVPTVIGWLKPVVLLPASALAGLAPHQLEAILAHELAHIRRHDYFVNLLQTLVETLLFYHPAVWWLSRTIRTERENCCDDLAVSLCGDPHTYARALADLEGLRGNGRLAMAATGGSLLQRVRRLLGAPASHSGRPPGWLAGSAAIVLMVGIAAGAVGTEALRAGQERATGHATAAPVESRETAAQTIDSARVPARAATRQTAEVTQARTAGEVVQAIRATTEVIRATAMQMVTTAGPLSGVVSPIIAEPLAPERIAIAVASHHTGIAIAAQAVDAVVTTRVTALEVGQVSEISKGRRRGNFIWSHNGDKLEVRYEGDIEFTDDDTDVSRLSPGGYLTIKDGGFLGGRTVEFRADASGNIQRRFWVGSSERPFEPEGRAWLAQALPRFIRQTGIGAPARVARILKSKGPSGVLAEISLIEGSWAKRIYFTQLFNTGALDAATLRQALAQAGREIESDYELASLLINSAQKLLAGEATRQAYFDAARTIQSDYELRRVFSAALKTPVSSSTLAGILATSTGIGSDYELASLLVQVAKLQPLDATTRGPFFAALATVGSAYDHRRVLSALGARTDLPAETVTAMLESGATMRSDYEQASFLLQIAKSTPVEGTLRSPFFRAVESIQSPYERGRVLQAVARRADASSETILAILRAAASMRGSYEKSQVLLAVASSHTITGSLRDAYVDAAENLGDYEQGRVLTALVKSERRR